MEGVKRIVIMLKQEEKYRIRAPVFFADLLKTLKKLDFPVKEKLSASYENKKFLISNDETYNKALEKAGFHGLSIGFDSKALTSSPSTPKVPKKRSAKAVAPSPKKSLKPSPRTPSKPLKTPKKGTSRPVTPSKSPNPAARAAKRSSTPLKSPRSVSLTPSKSPIKTPSSTPVKTPPSSIVNHAQSTPTSSLSPAASSTLIIPTTSFSISSHPRPQFSSQSFLDSNQPDNSSPAPPKDFEIQKSFISIISENKLKLVTQEPQFSFTLTDKAIYRSSRILLTDEGILLTGGSCAKYQAFLIKQDLTLTPLVSMNHPRFWHSVGFIDGYPAVVNGAERSQVPKLFINTVEVYKNKAWVDYPSTNICRASCSMTWGKEGVYLIGGVVTDGKQNTILTSIEKFEIDKWVNLSVTVPVALISPGVMIREQKIIVFGGERGSSELSKKVFEVDLEKDEVKYFKDLETATKFTYFQQVKEVGGKFFACDYGGSIVELLEVKSSLD